MLFLLQISRFFSRSNLICKWKWLYLPCRYRSYVGNSWKFMFWTYLQKKKNRPCLYFWLRLAPLKRYQWGSVYLLNYYIMWASGSEPEAVFSCALRTSGGLGTSRSPQRYEKRHLAVSSQKRAIEGSTFPLESSEWSAYWWGLKNHYPNVQG